MRNKLAVIIILWGLSGVVALFSNQLPVLSFLQSTGSVPIPLVFDAPNGYEFWSTKFEYSLITTKQKWENIPFDKKTYLQFSRHSIIHNTILIPLAMSPVMDINSLMPTLNSIFCQSQAWKPFALEPTLQDERVLKFSLQFKSSTKNLTNKKVEILCP